MGSLDIGLLSINISLDEAINTCVNRLFETLTLLKVLQSRKLNKCFFWLQRSAVSYPTANLQEK